jgi:TPR repeat protein
MTAQHTNQTHTKWIHSILVSGLLAWTAGCGPAGLSVSKEKLPSTEELAIKGDPVAQNQWGYELLNGIGTLQNIDEGLSWISKAADQGNKKAIYNLAVLHQTGKYTDLDLERSFSLMSKAARAGLPEAQTGLGLMYEKGQAVAPDMNEALYWYRRAAMYGKEATQKMEHYKKNLLSHREEQFLHGDRDAQFLLGNLYEQGADGVVPNPDEAVRWYEDAAVRGDAASQARLAIMLGLHGKPRTDKTTAYAWAKLAATSDQTGNYAKPLQNLNTVLTMGEKLRAETVYHELRDKVIYNEQDLGLKSTSRKAAK